MDTIRAAIYARVSTKPQAGEDKISVSDQLRECRKLIENEGWASAGEFVDPGISANTIDRPGLQALLGAVERFDVVLAWDFDRFYRERRSVAGYILDTLDEHRKQITSVKQPIPIFQPTQYDPRENDTPYLLREMAGFTAGIDNRRRFRTLQKGLKEKFNQGFMLHVPPYGYRLAFKVEDAKVWKLPRQVVPKEARVVRRIYREYIEGKSYQRIALGLTTDGIPSRRRSYWTPNVVGVLIRNPVYCGKVYRCHQKINGRFRSLPEEQWTIISGKHQSIVSEDVWARAQAVRKRKRSHNRSLGSPLLLSGLLRCGHCGWSMYKSGSGYYACGKHRELKQCQRNSYRRDKLEQEVAAFLFQVLRNEDLYDRVRTRQDHEQVRELGNEVKNLETLLAEFAQRRRRLFDLYEANHITQQEFIDRKAEHDRLKVSYEQTLVVKRQQLAKIQSQQMDRESFREALASIEQNWPQCDAMEKKRKLAEVIEKIVVANGTFKIYFRVDA